MAEQPELESPEGSVQFEYDHSSSSWVRRLGWIKASMHRVAKLETQILSKASACNIVRKYVRLPDGQQIWTLIARRRDLRQTQSLPVLAGNAGKGLGSVQTSPIDEPPGEPFISADDCVKAPEGDHDQPTVVDNDYENRTPIVLVHGMGSAASLFVKNLDVLAARRVVYALDLPGFGRSTRQRFSDDGARVEQQFLDAIEQWRIEMKLEKFILLGHSFGGYLVTLYALTHPDRVMHLILADPWGFPRSPSSGEVPQHLPLFLRLIGRVMSPTFPFALIRVAGPFGPGLVERFRPDLQRMYADVFDDNTILEYIYECNALEPSGENAFKALCSELAWARNPMIERVHRLPNRIGMTFIYGERSWIDAASGYLVRSRRPLAYVKVHVMPNAGHHVMAQSSDTFNAIVSRTCDAVDDNTLDVLLNEQQVRRATERPRSNSDESIATIGSTSNLSNGLVSPRSASNLGNIHWSETKSKVKSKAKLKRSFRSKSKQESSENGELSDNDEQPDGELRNTVHPRMNSFPPNTELQPGDSIQFRPISF